MNHPRLGRRMRRALMMTSAVTAGAAALGGPPDAVAAPTTPSSAAPGYSAMSYPNNVPFRSPRDTGFLPGPGSFSLMADQRRGAPPPWGPIPFWPLALMTAPLPARAGIMWWQRRTNLRQHLAHGLCPGCGY